MFSTFFFFFKQKTAYEMRISDWSSDVCSSDLGHIAGVVNPPEAEKYGYWTNERNAQEPEDWCNSADEHAGSWWPAWQDWVAAFSHGKVAARQPGDGQLKVIEDAPGSYVALQLGSASCRERVWQ